ncbi:E3 SUMO-protein ligase ZBED1 [Labeo rohita]|uniref:E3 SUMO-protein ligase ZBED1 n=1 Tax=Labeo rohita TaxID=84645 RepID=A0ABQ8L0F8_LABRO|nr:E3 SUMO-protein ligase ZBED1 [Labeo rohita]
MKKAVPMYKVPSKTNFSTNEIPRMYKEVRASVEEQLKEAVWISATTDLWTSSSGDHTSEKISEMFENMLQEWKISKESLCGITTDNATNMKKAFAEFPCGMQTLDSRIFSELEKEERMKKKQADLELPEHALIHDVVTRWGSTYEMISRFLEQQQAKRVTLSSLTPVLEHIGSEILSEQAEDNLLIRQMKQIMREDLQGRYTEQVERVLQISSFVDARFKGSFCKNLDDTVEACVEEAVNLATAVPLDREHPQAQRGENRAEPGSSSTTTTKKKEKSLSGLPQRITSSRLNKATSGNENVSDKVLSEMMMYKSLPTISVDTDPLAWWKMHADEMFLLANAARKYLCVPATSVPSERMFSTGGHILSPQQSRLSPENLLTFLHHNLT